jgi:hypothetical protein
MKALKLAVVTLSFLIGVTRHVHAQELFIKEEPASTIPKGVLGIRSFGEAYKEPGNQLRALTGLRLMYGLTPRLTIMLSGTASNHHSKQLPPDFPDHNTPQIGVHLPWRFNGLNAYAKYRLLSIDKEKQHFRIAGYGEASWLEVAHDEAEPDLLDDTKGLGAGVIATWLKNHFAASFTAGYIYPFDYQGGIPDTYGGGLPDVPVKVKYGKAINYSLSLGYLLFPRKYTSYKQTNINFYLEFLGKSYKAGQVFLENIGAPGRSYEIKGTAVTVFAPNNYVELHPGAQLILASNLRIDLSVGFPLINRSYVHYYPIYTIGIQRYFYH